MSSPAELVEQWPVTSRGAGWVDGNNQTQTVGAADHIFALASVTKALFAYAVLIAVEEGSMALDQPAGPDGSTVAHLLSHSSGLAPEVDSPDRPVFATVGSRRIYSNHGFDVLGDTLGVATGMAPADYLRLAVFEPLGMTASTLDGSPAHGGRSTVVDLLAFCRELLEPQLIHHTTLARATSPHLPDLSGVLPGFGRQDPNPWGLGFEIRGEKTPHWTGTANDPATFGHFGASGTFVWVDPSRHLGCVALTDRAFGPWAAQAWPQFSDAVISSAAHTL